MAWDWILSSSGKQVRFGDDESPYVIDAWLLEPGRLRVEDQEIVRGDSLRFGQDYRSGSSLSFSMWVNGETESATLQKLSELAAVWRNDGDRLKSGSIASLQHPNGRTVFGRPRDFQSDAQRVKSGYATVKARFDCIDDLWYGPQEATRIRFVPPSSGGLLLPAVAPFSFDSGETVRNSSVQVAGDVATWPVFEIFGPVANPSIEIVGVGTLVFKVTLAYDQFLRIDTRPWARWVQSGYVQNPSALSPFPGALSPSGARLSDMGLLPGTYSILLRGSDATGTSELSVVRYPAFTSF